MTDIRELIIDDLRKRPGMTGEEVAALHPDKSPHHIKKVLRSLCKNWADLYYEVSRDEHNTGHSRFRFYVRKAA